MLSASVSRYSLAPFMDWARDLMDLLLPSGCVSCGKWIPSRLDTAPDLVCAACRLRMRSGPWPRCDRCHWPKGTGRAPGTECRECADWSPSIVAARFAFELAPPVDDLVHGLKYEGWRELSELMGDAVARLDAPVKDIRNAVVVPVPTTPDRLRSRGYNQAELLARRFAHLRRLPMVNALDRRGRAGSQTKLTRDERRRNVQGAFAPTLEAARVRGGAVILVDDVLTTGATVSAAADALSKAEVREVVVLTFARAIPARAREVA